MKYQDYYKILGVSRDAKRDDIKRAYRKLARKYHPDVSKESDAEAKFKELNEAYEVLKDPEKRAAYDQLGKNWRAGEQFQPPPDWDANFEFSGTGFGEGDRVFSDFFESLFGQQGAHGFGRARRDFSRATLDHHAKIMIDLEDAFQGATRKITLQRPHLDRNGHAVSSAHTLEVKIPKGIRPGQQIRLRGQGAEGSKGKRGDLFLEIGFNAHRLYRIHGKDLELDLPLTPWEAALGASVEVPTPTGKVNLRIPQNARNGSKLRLKGRGFPGSEAALNGDLYAVISIEQPKADSDKAKALYEQMRRDLAFNPRQHWGTKP